MQRPFNVALCAALAAFLLLPGATTRETEAAVCGHPGEMVALLTRQWGFREAGGGISGAGTLGRLWLAEGGRWMVSTEDPGRRALCAVAIGDDWAFRPPAGTGDL